jgi:NAD(P)-dependent dehydrogenase (short-subunit alcohol dehydrogenase family)
MSKAKYNNPFSATVNGILDLFRKQEAIGVLKDEDRLDGKRCLVTGANSGLGFAVAQQMAERGAEVFMACRSGIPEAGEQIKKASGSEQITMLKIDLSTIKSIHAFIADVKARGLQFDVAVFNAAVVPGGAQKTEDGFDQMFMVNYLSKFILVNGLLEIGALKKGSSRLIFVNSESHRTNQEIDFDQLGVFEEYNMGKVISLYGYYKLLLNVFASELSRRQNYPTFQFSIFALCPGPVNSNIARAAPKFILPILKFIFSIFFSSPSKAAAPVMYLACSPSLEGSSDVYLHLMSKKEMDAKALDVETGRKLWEKSEKLLNRFAAASGV